MKLNSLSLALTGAALLLGAPLTFAQQPPAAAEAARQDALVREALARYDSGLEALQAQGSPAAQLAIGGVRELRMAEVVELALEKNLDIAVERLSPQAVDYQIAGIRNAYRPVASSTVGQRDQVNPATNQLNGGNSVNNQTTTYNFGVTQAVPYFGGNFQLTWNNTRSATNSTFSTYNPGFNSQLTALYQQPLLRGLLIDNNRQQLAITQINRAIADETLRATIASTLANVRNAYWDLVFTRSGVDVARRSLALAEKLIEDNQARVEVGTMAPIDVVQAEAEAANRRQALAVAEAALQTAELSLKRFIVSGTDDPLWRQELRPIDLPSIEPPPRDIEGAVRRALGDRTDLATARKNLDSSDITLRFFRSQTLPALDLNASYGATGQGGVRTERSGLGGTISNVIPGGYSDALRLLTQRDFPTWNLSVTLSYPIGGSNADAQYARARVQRNQSTARLRALELQVATEVTNTALTVQSNLRRVEAAQAARALAERRLEAEQSKFEVGLQTNFFVVQAQRDLADAQNAELRALADYRKSLVNFERVQEAPGGGGFGGGGGQ
ncbi:MAG: TolC family protein [Vicinamibacterales bacterium]|nr:TolC family protein [Vicinamibacterales bacterium]